jgi:hypothetical protein
VDAPRADHHRWQSVGETTGGGKAHLYRSPAVYRCKVRVSFLSPGIGSKSVFSKKGCSIPIKLSRPRNPPALAGLIPVRVGPNPRSSEMVFAAMQIRLGNAFAYRWRFASMRGRLSPLPNFGRWTS